MEGPSLHLAAEQLEPFVNRRIQRVSGNSKIGIDRLQAEVVRDIFAWGKHLVFQFDTFALRVHFMLWGTFASTVEGRSVTGDYRRTGPPRLVLDFPNGEITIWAASVKFIEDPHAKAAYDFSADVLAEQWDPKGAFRKVKLFPRDEIADVLLDQTIFAGVGNIIKNEVLFRTRVHPFTEVRKISDRKLKAIIKDARVFSFRFLELRRIFALRKNLEVYRRSICPRCAGKIVRKIHGRRARRSFYCPKCQGVRIIRSATRAKRHSALARNASRAPRRGRAARTRPTGKRPRA